MIEREGDDGGVIQPVGVESETYHTEPQRNVAQKEAERNNFYQVGYSKDKKLRLLFLTGAKNINDTIQSIFSSYTF